MTTNYPLVGFHFSVSFEGFSHETDKRFQQVSGLSATIDYETVQEGGEHRFVHHLPKSVDFGDLELKRGLVEESELIDWCNDAINNFRFKPQNLVIKLLDENNTPVYGWKVVHAVPIHWEISALDSMKSEIVVDSLKLKYRYFERIQK